jgi:hypothetical protein
MKTKTMDIRVKDYVKIRNSQLKIRSRDKSERERMVVIAFIQDSISKVSKQTGTEAESSLLIL